MALTTNATWNAPAPPSRMPIGPASVTWYSNGPSGMAIAASIRPPSAPW